VDRSGIDPREASALEAERRANAAINIGFAVTFTLGPALAGLAVPAFGAPAAMLIDTASFVICGAMLLDLRPHSDDADTSSVRARVRAAWRHINEAPGLRGLLLAEAVALVFFEFSPPIEVAYAKSTLHAGDGGYGLLLGVWGLGVAVGSIVFARSIRRSLGMLLSASTLAVGLAYLGWAIAPSLAIACVAGLIGGVGNGVQWAALISAVQRLTPQNLHGRMMGAVESLGAICPGIGLALGGAIAALSSPRDAFLVAGIGASLSTIAFVRLPLGSLTGATPAPVATDVEPEWAPPNSSHSSDSHSSSVRTSP
jgi:predicted MFS family arabinose efflux permease